MAELTPEILEFHKKRTDAHIAGVNYFAGLVGARFPDHDADKSAAPLLEPYALKNYANYHPDFPWTDSDEAAFDRARRAHHAAAAHHPESYAAATDMPDDRITEMLCDWSAANKEQLLIRNVREYIDVADFFAREALPEHRFSAGQSRLIVSLMADMVSRFDEGKFLSIWEGIGGQRPAPGPIRTPSPFQAIW